MVGIYKATLVSGHSAGRRQLARFETGESIFYDEACGAHDSSDYCNLPVMRIHYRENKAKQAAG